jgi:hypothetical protein
LYNRWVEIALPYLPRDVFDATEERLALVSTGQVDGYRVAREFCEKRELFVLAEHILTRRLKWLGGAQIDGEIIMLLGGLSSFSRED